MARIFFKKAQQPASQFSTAALISGITALILFSAAGPGYDYGLWGSGDNNAADLQIRYILSVIAAVLAALGALSALIAGLHTLSSPRTRFSWRGGYGAVINVTLSLIFGLILQAYVSTPKIHDVSTSPNKLPNFTSIPTRLYKDQTDGGRQDVSYAAERAKIQPDLMPIDLGNQPLARAHQLVLAAASRMGWKIVASDPAVGHIEALDSVMWYGFQDQIAIDIEATASGTLIHARSMSAVTTHDLGINTKRLRDFAAEMAQASEN